MLLLGEVAGAGEVLRLADDAVVVACAQAVAVLQAVLHEGDAEVGDVDAEPAAAEALGGVDGGAAAAEGVEHDVAGVAAGADDALEEGKGFLGGVAEAFLGVGGYFWRFLSKYPRRLVSTMGPVISSQYLNA